MKSRMYVFKYEITNIFSSVAYNDNSSKNNAQQNRVLTIVNLTAKSRKQYYFRLLPYSKTFLCIIYITHLLFNVFCGILFTVLSDSGVLFGCSKNATHLI